MASTRTDDATRIAQFPAETHPRAVPISIRIGEQSTLHLQLYFSESSSLPSLIYDLACRRSRMGLGSVNFRKTDGGVLSAGTSKQNARIAGI